MNKTELTYEYLKDRFIDKKWSYFQIYKETGWSKSTIWSSLGKYNLRRKRTLKKLDLSGRIFGRLTVLNKAPNKQNSICWNCKCGCGKEIQVLTGNLLKNNTTSCGCLRKEFIGEKHPSWKGYGKVPLSVLSMINHNSIKRGIYLDLNIEQLSKLFEVQNEKCALSGLPLTFSKNIRTASLDRIDSSKGYVDGNIQWIHKDINKMKNTLDEEKFIEYCKLIAEHKS